MKRHEAIDWLGLEQHFLCFGCVDAALVDSSKQVVSSMTTGTTRAALEAAARARRSNARPLR
jgi:hypothetical protein